MFRQILRQIATKTQNAGKQFRSASTIAYPSLNEFRTYTAEDGFVLNSIYEPITLSDLTIDQYVWKHIGAWHDKIAVVSQIIDCKCL